MAFGDGQGRRGAALGRLGALRRHLSYANVAASLALFLALGGTSYAAIRISSRNIRNAAVTRDKIAGNAVTSTKVRNGTLLSKDFKAGQLPSGPPGAPGATGATGATGPAGTARAYGSVQPGTNGVLNPKNIARVYTPSAGIYCVTLPGRDPGDVGRGDRVGQPQPDHQRLARAARLLVQQPDRRLQRERHPARDDQRRDRRPRQRRRLLVHRRLRRGAPASGSGSGPGAGPRPDAPAVDGRTSRRSSSTRNAAAYGESSVLRCTSSQSTCSRIGRAIASRYSKSRWCSSSAAACWRSRPRAPSPASACRARRGLGAASMSSA